MDKIIVTSLILCFVYVIVNTVIEYIRYTSKRNNISHSKKIIYTIIDFLHISVGTSVILIFFLSIYSVKFLKDNIYWINIYFLIIILQFFYFKRCFLSILADRILERKKTYFVQHRIFKYQPNIEEEDECTYINAWMDNFGQYLCILTIFLNIHSFFI